MTPLERSTLYRGFAEAFRGPGGGAGILSDDLVLPESEEASQLFLEAFDPAAAKGACALHESSHVTRDQPNLYEELVRFYDHFDLRRSESAELPDHLSVELEFMHFLCFRQNELQPDDETTAGLVRAQMDFLQKHLVPLCQRIHAKVPVRSGKLFNLVTATREFTESDLKDLKQASHIR